VLNSRKPTLNLPPVIREPFRSALAAAAEGWIELLGSRLVSIVLFGSVARGDAGENSDVDVLVIAEGFPRSLSERRGALLDAWRAAREQQGLPAVPWSLVTKTPEEARYHSPLYLDITEDGILLLDRDGFFQAVLEEMRVRLRELGSRRVYLSDGNWYWDLKPDFRYGEIVEI
jgi:hypothetical protein